MEQNPAKLEFTTLIFDLLKLIRSEEGQVQNFLGIANRHVIPQLENPLLLANFFTVNPTSFSHYTSGFELTHRNCLRPVPGPAAAC